MVPENYENTFSMHSNYDRYYSFQNTTAELINRITILKFNVQVRQLWICHGIKRNARSWYVKRHYFHRKHPKGHPHRPTHAYFFGKSE